MQIQLIIKHLYMICALVFIFDLLSIRNAFVS